MYNYVNTSVMSEIKHFKTFFSLLASCKLKKCVKSKLTKCFAVLWLVYYVLVHDWLVFLMFNSKPSSVVQLYIWRLLPRH